MNLGQLYEALTSARMVAHSANFEVIVRGSKLAPRKALSSDEWELLGVEIDTPCKPWEGGEAVVVLKVEG